MHAFAAVAAALALYTVPGTTLRVSVPPGWRVVDRAAAQSIMRSKAKTFPQLAGSIEETAKAKSPLRLLMYDPHASKGFVTNASIVVDKSPTSSLSRDVDIELTGLAQALDPFDFRQVATTVAGRPAIAVSFKTVVDPPGGTKYTVYDIQTYFLDGKKLIVVTESTLPRQLKKQTAALDRIVGSLTFGQ
jgi:hypothetical protein